MYITITEEDYWAGNIIQEMEASGWRYLSIVFQGGDVLITFIPIP